MIEDLIAKVYHQEGTTHTFNLSPYFQATYDFQDTSFTGQGTFGNGNGVITYSEKAQWNDESLSWAVEQSGIAKSSPFADFYPRSVLEDTFDTKMSLNLDMSGLKYSQISHINDAEITEDFSVSINSMHYSSKKMILDFSIKNDAKTPEEIDPFWQMWLNPTGTTEIDVTATVRNSCMDNPLDRGCSAKLEISGGHSGTKDGLGDVDFGENVAKYKVGGNKASLSVEHNEAEVFMLSFSGFQTHEVYSIHYQLAGEDKKLFLQFVGPSGVGALETAAENFVEPFETFITAMANKEEIVPYAFAYADKIMKFTKGKEYFNFYSIIEATRIESEFFAEMFGAKSIQDQAEKGCDSLNAIVENMMVESADFVTGAREFVKQIVNADGEAHFDNWFAKLVKS